MKEKVELRKGLRDQIMNYVWRGTSARVAAKLAGIRPKTLRQYRKTHGIFDTRLQKLWEEKRAKQ